MEADADRKKKYKKNVVDILKANYDLWTQRLDKFKDKVEEYG